MTRTTRLVLLSSLLLACGPSAESPRWSAPRRGQVIASPRSLSASFVDATGEQRLDPRERSAGDCLVRTWRAPAEGPRAIPVGAGTVSAQGTRSCSAELADGEYFCSADDLWDGVGAGSLTITATGAEVPAFEVTIPTPLRPSITVPPTAAASTDLVLRWDGGSGRVRAMAGATTVTDDNGDYLGMAIVCEADATRGELTVPASVLTEMLSYDPGGTYLRSLTVLSVDGEEIEAGDYQIDVLAWEVLGEVRVAF